MAKKELTQTEKNTISAYKGTTLLKILFFIIMFLIIINLMRNLIYNNSNNMTFTAFLECLYNIGQETWQIPTLENLYIVNSWGILEFVKDFINLFINLFNIGIYIANSIIILINFLLNFLNIFIVGRGV